MDQFNRTAVICDLILTTNKQHILPSPLKDLLKVFQSKMGNLDMSMKRGGGRRQYYINDLKFFDNEKIAVLYICRRDEDASDPVFSKEAGKGKFTSKIIEKATDEGDGTGAHIVIQLDDKPVKDGFSYFTAIETSEGLGRVIARDLMKAAFNAIYKDDDKAMTALRTTGASKKPEPYRPLFEISGIPKDFLEDDLKKGVGTGLYLKRSIPETLISGEVSKLLSEEQLTLLPNPAENTLLPKTIEGLTSLIRGALGRKTAAEYRYTRDGRPQRIKFQIFGDMIKLDDFLLMKINVGPTTKKMAKQTSDAKINDEFASMLKSSLLAKIATLD